jgi:pimeloyl-ACP methyl ester carboxylesterase
MKIFVAVWAFVGLLLTGTVATAQPAKPTIVLVHGAFADSSSWYGVIAILERDGYSVVAAANPLRSVKGDADTVRALLASINTPVVLVGHSYGGMVISNAANGRANVKALVYGAVKLLPSAVLIIVSRPCLAQISAKSRWKPAENAWRVPTGRPFKLPD